MAAAIVCTFASAFSGKVAFFERDILGFWYPYIEVFVQTIGQGEWPLWNRHFGFGEPLLAAANVSPAYPPTWLNLLLSPELYYKLLVIGHAFWAALGAWRLARSMGLSDQSGAVAGVAFGVSGPLLSAANLFHHFIGATFIPWVLLGGRRVIEAPGPAAVLGLGLAGAGQILSGSGDMCLMSAVLGLGMIAERLAALRVMPGGRRRALLRLVLAGTLAVSVSAVQWLPTAAHVPGSFRATADRATVEVWSVHPLSLLDVAVPQLASRAPISDELRRELFESRAPLLSSLYAGFPVLALALLGLLLGKRRAGTWILSALLAALLALALGKHLPLHGFIAWLPGIGMIRYPSKFCLPAALCLALLAAYGVEAWLQTASASERRRGRVVSLLAGLGMLVCLGTAATLLLSPGAAAPLLSPAANAAIASAEAAKRLLQAGLVAGSTAVLLALRFRRENATTAATVALLALTAGDLIVAGRPVNDLAPVDLVRRRPVAVDLLKQAGARRIYSASSIEAACRKVERGPEGYSLGQMAVSATLDGLTPPAAARWGLFGSFDGEFTGLGRTYSWPMTTLAEGLRGSPAGARLLGLSGVDHIVWTGREVFAGTSPLADLPSPVDCPLRLLRVDDRLPWAYVVGATRAGDSAEALLEESFDPRREAMVAGGQTEGHSEGFSGVVRLAHESANTVTVDVEANRQGRLVLLEAFDAGWRATVNGRAVTVERTNVLFRSVVVPEGRSRVRFFYRPPSAIWGAALSLLGILTAVGLALCATGGGLRVSGCRSPASGAP